MRVRPLSDKEKLERSRQCVSFVPNEPQIILGKDRPFTYDYVWSPDEKQDDVYKDAVYSLIDTYYLKKKNHFLKNL